VTGLHAHTSDTAGAMWSAVAPCCGGVTKIAGGRHRDDRRARPQRPGAQEAAPQEQRPKSRVRPVSSATLDDVTTLEAQASRLRYSIVRRRNVAGCSNTSDNVSDIISHYEKILERTEQQIRELRAQTGKAKPLVSPTHSRTDSVSTTCSSTGNWQ